MLTNSGARGRITRRTKWFTMLGGITLLASACSAADGASESTNSVDAPEQSWDQVVEEAQGQTVSLWMWGGDTQGNAYVDDVLAPAAQELGVTLNRVPITDTKDAINRILAENQAGRTDGSVDLVWVNGDNFRTGQQADIWLCGWADDLPSSTFTAPGDPLLTNDFGTPVNGCESPWHKAQFTFVYDSARVPNPPQTMSDLLDWIRVNPGRFTYPAPPDFTGSVFVREALYASAGGYANVPAQFTQQAYDDVTPQLWDTLDDLRGSLWRSGETYPKDTTQLDELFATGQVDFTMTYGPATLTELVADGTFPSTTKVLTLEEGTIGNASFLAIPITSGNTAGAQVVADLALSPAQQVAKADPGMWGQFTALDVAALPAEAADTFSALPASPVVPPYDVLSRNANPELAAAWVPALDEGWRRNVLAAR
jgi:putative spermidine/putrescine transport system substrate-binding protein